eukprot:6466613-Amphidinium_carterae.1
MTCFLSFSVNREAIRLSVAAVSRSLFHDLLSEFCLGSSRDSSAAAVTPLWYVNAQHRSFRDAVTHRNRDMVWRAMLLVLLPATYRELVTSSSTVRDCVHRTTYNLLQDVLPSWAGERIGEKRCCVLKLSDVQHPSACSTLILGTSNQLLEVMDGHDSFLWALRQNYSVSDVSVFNRLQDSRVTKDKIHQVA